jgi:tight adherence protein C
VEAGLDILGAVKKVVRIFLTKKNPFAVELNRLSQNINLGMTRQKALKVMADRVDIMELYSFTTILIQSEKMGTSISEVLKDQAARMREERFMRAERIGAMASQKLLVPTVLLIFPVVFMIIFGPLVLQFIF